MKRLSALYPILIVGFLAAGSFWLEYVVRNERPAGLGNDRHEPDAVIEKFETTRFDKNGRLQALVVGQRLHHYPDDNSADIDAPVVTFTNTNHPLRIASNTARITDEARKVVMTGKVRGIRPATPTSAEQTLATEEMTVFTEDEVALSYKPTTFTQGDTRIDGSSAEWNNATGILKMTEARAGIARKK